MLTQQGEWGDTTLRMYVDDRVIFAQGDSWHDVSTMLSTRYHTCEEWLHRANLSIEPEKTELIFFCTLRAHQDPPPPDHLYLPDTDCCTYYKVSPKAMVRYLGFFIKVRLGTTCQDHV
jgi:hypothetical protein